MNAAILSQCIEESGLLHQAVNSRPNGRHCARLDLFRTGVISHAFRGCKSGYKAQDYQPPAESDLH
jgi:hypothetical protein